MPLTKVTRVVINKFMELYDKLNQLEEKLDRVVAEVTEARHEKANIQQAHDELAGKFAAIESELERARQDKDAIRDKIENLLNKLG